MRCRRLSDTAQTLAAVAATCCVDPIPPHVSHSNTTMDSTAESGTALGALAATSPAREQLSDAAKTAADCAAGTLPGERGAASAAAIAYYTATAPPETWGSPSGGAGSAPAGGEPQSLILELRYAASVSPGWHSTAPAGDAPSIDGLPPRLRICRDSEGSDYDEGAESDEDGNSDPLVVATTCKPVLHAAFVSTPTVASTGSGHASTRLRACSLDDGPASSLARRQHSTARRRNRFRVTAEGELRVGGFVVSEHGILSTPTAGVSRCSVSSGTPGAVTPATGREWNTPMFAARPVPQLKEPPAELLLGTAAADASGSAEHAGRAAAAAAAPARPAPVGPPAALALRQSSEGAFPLVLDTAVPPHRSVFVSPSRYVRPAAASVARRALPASAAGTSTASAPVAAAASCTSAISRVLTDPSPDEPPLRLPFRSAFVRMAHMGGGASGVVYKAVHMPTLSIVAIKSIDLSKHDKLHAVGEELAAMYANRVALPTGDCLVPPGGDGGLTPGGEATPLHMRAGCSGASACSMASAASERSSDGGCPFVTPLLDAFYDPVDHTCNFVMPFCNAGSLEDLVQAGGCISEPVLAAIAWRGLRALSFLASRRVIHRDVKPSNLLLNQAGDVVLGDFGVATRLPVGQDVAFTNAGTTEYLSPERVLDASGGHTFNTDVFGLGMSLLAVALGRHPIPPSHRSSYWALESFWRDASVEDLLPPPSAGFSAEFTGFLRLCLDKDASACSTLPHAYASSVKMPRGCGDACLPWCFCSCLQRLDLVRPRCCRTHSWRRRRRLTSARQVTMSHAAPWSNCTSWPAASRRAATPPRCSARWCACR